MRSLKMTLGKIWALSQWNAELCNFNMFLALTWCHRSPVNTPTRKCPQAIGTEHELDNISLACYIGRQGGARDTLASNQNATIIEGAAALLHQDCPVTVCDFQKVATSGMWFNDECSEL